MPRRATVPPKTPGRYRAPALEKGLDILELLSAHPEGLSQADVARTLERSVGEIFRMLNCLVERGYLSIQRPGDRYVLTLKLFELSHRHAPLARLLDAALPLMRALAEEIHQSCHLVVTHEGRGIVIAQADAPGEIGFAVRVGSVIQLSATASGRVLLAFQDEEDRERLLALAGSSDASAEAARQAALFEKIRRRGYEDMESTRIRGVHDFSYPVFNHRGAAVGALTVPFIERLDRAEAGSVAVLRAALLDASARLSVLLGSGARGERNAPGT
ncbi:MAG: IclR family transcriptional regulator [Planctomycetes bacterium]|nr:IclR family transcriptional regulator [Planctomycetota bacterium]